MMKNEYDAMSELEEMVSSDNGHNLLEAARAPMLTESQMLEFVKNGEYHVRKSVASRLDLTPEVIGEFLRSEPEPELVALALRGYDGSELLSEVAKNSDSRIRRLAASHPNTPESLLLALATDNHEMVRHAIVAREEIPIYVQRILARDPSVEIRRDLARHDELFYSAYEILKEDPDPEVINALEE